MATGGIMTATSNEVTLAGPMDPTQTRKASKALLKHLTSSDVERNIKSDRKDLFEADSKVEEPIWLVVSTKKHIVPQKRLKPSKISLPHPILNSPTLSICLITPDPQRTYKDIVADASFPASLTSRIKRVIDIKKLAAKYHSFESRRLLLDSHDVFLADDRIITYLPKLLGKTFYNTTSKRPVPVRLQVSLSKDEKQKKNAALPSLKPRKEEAKAKPVLTPIQFAHEIERTLSTTTINLSSSATTSVRVGLSTFTYDQLATNVEAVSAAMVDKFIPKKWKGVKSIHIKGPNTMALPIWLAEELWEDETQVLEDDQLEQTRMNALSKKKKKKLLGSNAPEAKALPKRGAEDLAEDTATRKKSKRENQDDDLSQEMKARREKLRKQRLEIEEGLNTG